MLSREDYGEKIFSILVKQHGWTEKELDAIQTTIGHCFMKGRDPVKVAKALADEKKSPKPKQVFFVCDGKHFVSLEKATAYASKVFNETGIVLGIERK